MQNTWIWAVVAVVLLGGGYWWYTSSQTPVPIDQGASSPVGESTTSTDTTPVDNTFAALITYSDNGYSPATVTIKKGETVRFVNNSTRDT